MTGDGQGRGPLGPGSVLAGYRIESQLGAGGMAVVYRAADERLGRPAALKVMAAQWAEDEDFRRRFIAESRAAAAVDDPHVIPVYGAGEESGRLYIAMRLVDGPDLKALLRQEGTLSPERAVELLAPVASALDSAHAAGLVHRDVKPANILVGQRPGWPDHVYLTDFGVSKLTAAGAASLTGTGQYLGTPEYTSPEHAKGERLDGRADQYALACVAYQALTGRLPFERDDGLKTLVAHMSAPPPALTGARPDLPSLADPVLARALAKSPGDRYRTCRDFIDALRAALHAQTVRLSIPESVPPAVPPPPSAPPPGYPAPPHPATRAATLRRRPGRRAILATGGVLVAVGAVTAGIVAFESGGAPVIGKPALLARFADPSGSEVDGIAFSPDGRYFADYDSDGDAYLWDTATHKRAATIVGTSSSHSVSSLAFSPDGGSVAFADQTGGDVYRWNVASRTTAKAAGPFSGSPSALAFSPDGQTLAVEDDNGRISLWKSPARAAAALPAPAGIDTVAGYPALDFAPDGTSLVASDGGNAYLWKTGDRKAAAVYTDSGNSDVNDVSFSPDGSTIAIAADSSGGTTWNAATHKATAATAGLSQATMESASFSPAGRYAAFGDNDGTTSLWDSTTRRVVATLPGPSGQPTVDTAVFSPDGRAVAVGDSDGDISLWRVSGS